MSTLIKLKRSAVPGRVPTTAQLELGEIAINTADGKIYIKQYDAGSNTSSIVEFSADPSDLLDLLKGVDGANSGLDADLLDGLDSTQFLRSDEDDTFNGNLTITGDLTVSGNTTYVNTETILLSDNIITLNANFTGPFASQNAGIEVERGGETNVVLQWNETQNYWEIASGGTTGRILTTGDEGSGNGLDADTLDGQEGTYYLDFTNFTSLPDPQIDVTLSGKVTGTGTTTLTNLGNGSISITTELANTTVTAGTYGTSSQIPVITVDEDGRLTNASTVAVAGVDAAYWTIANNTFTIETVDGGVFNTIIDEFSDITVGNLTATTIDTGNVAVTGSLTATTIDSGNVAVTGDITVTGTVDGRDIAADGSKLDGIEAGATADQSNTEIFNAVLSLDGAGSGLDADLLDGANGTFYLDYNNFFNVPAATFDLTLTGKVTGSAFSNSGVMTVVTELANTGVTSGTYGTSSQIPVITVDEDGRITAASNVAVAGVDVTYWSAANNTYTIETVDGGVFNTIIEQFNTITVDGSANVGGDLNVNGNIIVGGLVDGRDIAADGAKLDLLEDDLTVTLTGKVTGTVTSNTGTVTIATELANTGVTAGTYGSSSQIPVITVDEDGRITLASNAAVAGVVGTNWYSANNTFAIETGDGGVFNTVIDDFTNLDADTLNGNTVQQILDAAATNTSNAVASGVGTGIVTLTANNGLIGFGEFGLNDFSNTAITIEHADTSSVSDVDNSNGNVLQDITFDTYGHVQTVGSVDLDGRYYTETELDGFLSGKVDNTVNIIAGTGLSGGGPLTANVTISHADTSSVANTGTLDLANAEVISSVSFDEFGHVVAITTGKLAALTQGDADLRYVNVDGDTMTGNLTVPELVANTVILDHAAHTTDTATTTTIFSTPIWSFDATTYNSAEVIITATQGINRHITKLLIVHNDTTASATEFGTIYTNTSLATYDVGLSTGNVTLSVTPSTGTSIEYKIAATLIID